MLSVLRQEIETTPYFSQERKSLQISMESAVVEGNRQMLVNVWAGRVHVIVIYTFLYGAFPQLNAPKTLRPLKPHVLSPKVFV